MFWGYAVGLSVGISLMFKTSLRAAGFWIGLCVGLGLCAIINFIIVQKTNWQNEIKMASIRADTKLEKRGRKREIDK